MNQSLVFQVRAALARTLEILCGGVSAEAGRVAEEAVALENSLFLGLAQEQGMGIGLAPTGEPAIYLRGLLAAEFHQAPAVILAAGEAIRAQSEIFGPPPAATADPQAAEALADQVLGAFLARERAARILTLAQAWGWGLDYSGSEDEPDVREDRLCQECGAVSYDDSDSCGLCGGGVYPPTRARAADMVLAELLPRLPSAVMAELQAVAAELPPEVAVGHWWLYKAPTDQQSEPAEGADSDAERVSSSAGLARAMAWVARRLGESQGERVLRLNAQEGRELLANERGRRLAKWLGPTLDLSAMVEDDDEKALAG